MHFHGRVNRENQGDRMRFRAVTQQSGKTATGINVPAEIVSALGTSKRSAVRVSINGYRYRSTVAPMGGAFMLPLSAEYRTAAGVAADDTVEVDLELDTASREVSVPPDLVTALDRDDEARRFFDGLSYSNKQRLVLAIEGAKNRDARPTHREHDQQAARRAQLNAVRRSGLSGRMPMPTLSCGYRPPKAAGNHKISIAPIGR
jgi:hypothetical protein